MGAWLWDWFAGDGIRKAVSKSRVVGVRRDLSKTAAWEMAAGEAVVRVGECGSGEFVFGHVGGDALWGFSGAGINHGELAAAAGEFGGDALAFRGVTVGDGASLCGRTALTDMIEAGFSDKEAREISGYKIRAVFDSCHIVAERRLRQLGERLEAHTRQKMRTPA